jgi:hypothetical protein
MSVAPHPSAPLSVLPGVVWPGLPNAAGQRMLAVQFQFTQSEAWSAEQLRQVQFMQLAQLLQHARSTVPFYRDRLPELRGGVIDPAAFAQIPLLQRPDREQVLHEMAAARDPLYQGLADLTLDTDLYTPAEATAQLVLRLAAQWQRQETPE